MNHISFNISLPEVIGAFIESQVAEGGYGNPSEYICALVHEAQQRQGKETLESILMEGLANGDPRSHRQRKLEELRQKIDQGLAQLDRGEGIPAEEVLRELRERNPHFTRHSS